MTEVVVALLMMLNGNLIEFTYKEKMSDCLKSKRIWTNKEITRKLLQIVHMIDFCPGPIM